MHGIAKSSRDLAPACNLLVGFVWTALGLAFTCHQNLSRIRHANRIASRSLINSSSSQCLPSACRLWSLWSNGACEGLSTLRHSSHDCNNNPQHRLWKPLTAEWSPLQVSLSSLNLSHQPAFQSCLDRCVRNDLIEIASEPNRRRLVRQNLSKQSLRRLALGVAAGDPAFDAALGTLFQAEETCCRGSSLLQSMVVL